MKYFLNRNNISVILDPCCGNAFHTFLFDTFCGFNTISNDNQEEYLSWQSVEINDGLTFLNELNDKEHTEGALILSWIEGEELAYTLLESFCGNIIISIGNWYLVFSTWYLVLGINTMDHGPMVQGTKH